MKIYIYVDNDDLTDIVEPFEQAMKDFVESSKFPEDRCRFVHLDQDDGESPDRVTDWDLGLVLDTNKKFDLKEPLNFLNRLAKEHEQEFVVGHFDEDTGEPESVCYFGYEEGRPDLFEIGSYLGLKK